MNKLLLIIISTFLLADCDNTPKAKRTHRLSPEGFISASLSPNFALVGNVNGYAEFWQLKPRQLIHTWQHTDEKNGVIYSAISANEEYAITAERESLAWWRVSDGTLMNVWYLPNIHSVSLSHDGKFALIGLKDKAIYYSLMHGKTKYAFPHEQIVTQADIKHDNNFAITGSADYSAKLWDLTTGNLVHTWQHNSKLSKVATSPNGTYALTNEGLGTVRVWRTTSGRLYKQLGNKLSTITALAFSNDSTHVVLGHVASRIEQWNIKKGTRVNFWRPQKEDSWQPSASTPLALSFTANNKGIYSITSNGYFQLWQNTAK